MNSDQGYSSVYVNWTKQVCLQTRLKWWEWWGTPDIIWNRVPDRRRSKRKWTITKCCLTVCRSIEKRHGVWAGASIAGVQWLFMQHISDICDSDSDNQWGIPHLWGMASCQVGNFVRDFKSGTGHWGTRPSKTNAEISLTRIVLHFLFVFISQ